VGEYLARAGAVAATAVPPVELVEVRSWHREAGLIELLAERLTSALAALPSEPAGTVEVLFTAHSLPSRVLDLGDPYPDQVGETAEAVARAAGVTRWRVAWQSAGRTPEPWLGPGILDVIRDLPANGTRAVVVCPIGFVSDHLEVLYDIDIEARQVAEEAGPVLTRTESLNDDPRFLAVLADVVTAAAGP